LELRWTTRSPVDQSLKLTAAGRLQSGRNAIRHGLSPSLALGTETSAKSNAIARTDA